MRRVVGSQAQVLSCRELGSEGVGLTVAAMIQRPSSVIYGYDILLHDVPWSCVTSCNVLGDCMIWCYLI